MVRGSARSGRRPQAGAISCGLCSLCDLCVENPWTLLAPCPPTQLAPRALRIWNGTLLTMPRTSDEKR